MTATEQLSAACRQALEVLVEADRTGRVVREGNATSDPGAPARCGRRHCGALITYWDGRWHHSDLDVEMVLAHRAAPAALRVHWRARTWLGRQWYITTHRVSGGLVCRLTDAGRHAATEAGIS